MKRFARWWLALFVMLASVAAHAQTNVGFVNTQQVLEQAPQAKAASERLKQEFAPREAVVESAQKRLEDLRGKLERDAAVLSEPERTKLERELLVQQREVKRVQTEYTEDLNLRRNQEFAKFQREAGDVVAAIAKEEGYDLVIEGGVVYASAKVDITEKVLGRLRDKFAKAEPKTGK